MAERGGQARGGTGGGQAAQRPGAECGDPSGAVRDARPRPPVHERRERERRCILILSLRLPPAVSAALSFLTVSHERTRVRTLHTADSTNSGQCESESGGRLRGAPMPHESQGRSSLGTPRRQRLLPVALCSHRPYCLPLTIPSSRWRCSHSRCRFAAASADVPGPPVEGRAIASVRQNHFVLKQNSPQSSSGSQVH